MSKIELILQHFLEKIPDSAKQIKDRYVNLYSNYPEDFKRVFSYLHQTLNELFEFLNSKNRGTGGYYNAHESRQLLFIIESVEDMNRDLIGYGEEIVTASNYQAILDSTRLFLAPYNGSAIPENFPKIHLIHHEPVFSTATTKIRIPSNQCLDLHLIWEGAFSTVSKFTDPSYGKTFAVKKLKKSVTAREIERFEREFKILNWLNFPYILEVYSFDSEKHSYTMEYCDITLKNYVTKNSNKLTFLTRKRIALQFLYATNYLSLKKILHRDISYNNILIKEFEGAAMIKLSDFWLIKEHDSNFTKIDTEVKWTIIDPSLTSFKDYSILNEIYAIGFVVNFIFTWKQSFQASKTSLSKIIEKCTSSDLKSRYQTIGEIISIIEVLPEETTL